MTRESKLALIVGFGLILFVGILVSDHFSEGQRQEAAHLLAQRGGARGGSSPVSISPLPIASNGESRAVQNGGDAPTQPPQPQDEIVFQQGPSQNGAGGLNGPRGTQPSNEFGVPDRNGPGSEIARGEVPPPPTAPVQVTPEIRLYPVKEGETLYSICAAHYGDSSLWQALAAFNRNVVPEPARMRKGVTLRLPPIELLRPGHVVAQNEAPAAPSSAPAAPPASATVRTISYTVQQGDSLGGIAAKQLGSSRRWKELAKLNEDVVPDPHALKPGIVIRVPQRG